MNGHKHHTFSFFIFVFLLTLTVLTIVLFSTKKYFVYTAKESMVSDTDYNDFNDLQNINDYFSSDKDMKEMSESILYGLKQQNESEESSKHVEMMNNTMLNSSTKKLYWGFSDAKFIDHDFQEKLNPGNGPLSFIEAMRRMQLLEDCVGFVVSNAFNEHRKKTKMTQEKTERYIVENQTQKGQENQSQSFMQNIISNVYLKSNNNKKNDHQKYSCIFIPKNSFKKEAFAADNNMRCLTVFKRQHTSNPNKYCVRTNIVPLDIDRQRKYNQRLNKNNIMMTLEQARTVCESHDSCAGFSMDNSNTVGNSKNFYRELESSPQTQIVPNRAKFFEKNNMKMDTVKFKQNPIYMKTALCSDFSARSKNELISDSFHKYARF